MSGADAFYNGMITKAEEQLNNTVDPKTIHRLKMEISSLTELREQTRGINNNFAKVCKLSTELAAATDPDQIEDLRAQLTAAQAWRA